MRRARTYIDEHLHEPVVLADIAAAARLSPRGLHAAFRREYGITPMAHLRAARPPAARQDLLDGDPTSGATVADIARHRGFAHLGRFAASYRDAYGETPSQTLRRCDDVRSPNAALVASAISLGAVVPEPGQEGALTRAPLRERCCALPDAPAGEDRSRRSRRCER